MNAPTATPTPAGDAATHPRGAGGGVGLRTTRARLEQLYGAEYMLSLRPGPGGGAVAEVVLPYHTAADLHAEAAPSLV